MARDYTFNRQQAEDLVDLLEETPDRVLHDMTCAQFADELRELFGMCSHTQSLINAEEMKNGKFVTVDLNVKIYEGPKNFFDIPSPLIFPD